MEEQTAAIAETLPTTSFQNQLAHKAAGAAFAALVGYVTIAALETVVKKARARKASKTIDTTVES